MSTNGFIHGPGFDWRTRLGALGVLAAIAVFAVTVAILLADSGTAYQWPVNMLSDLGDSTCHVRGGRWICSPAYAVFNTGVIVTGLLLAASGWWLRRLWGSVFGGSVSLMGVGLVVAAAFPAGAHAGLHLAGVVLALVVPGLAMLLSAIRPATAWLGSQRVGRGVLGAVALVFSAENRLPGEIVPQGAGQAIIVGCIVAALGSEATRVLTHRPRRSPPARSSAQTAEPGP